MTFGDGSLPLLGPLFPHEQQKCWIRAVVLKLFKDLLSSEIICGSQVKMMAAVNKAEAGGWGGGAGRLWVVVSFTHSPRGGHCQGGRSVPRRLLGSGIQFRGH